MNKRIRVGLTTARITNDTVSSQRRLPDLVTCRTRYLGQTVDFSACLMENRDGCEYAQRLADCVYCHHPDRRSSTTDKDLMVLFLLRSTSDAAATSSRPG
jgi:hypothetical protein